LQFDQPLHLELEPVARELLVVERFGRIQALGPVPGANEPRLFFDVGAEETQQPEGRNRKAEVQRQKAVIVLAAC
jgi:hypothetical protein